MSKYSLKSLQEGMSPEEKKLMHKMYWRSHNGAGLMFAYSRYMGPALAYAMYPLINWLYKDKSPEEKLVALKRQGEFWNMEAAFHNFCIGILASLEKDHAQTGNTSVETITSVKASMIGPFSAIGDTIFWITWRILLTGIALNFSLQGSIAGPLIFIIGYNVPKYYARWHLQLLGYRVGTEFLTSMGRSGVMQKITRSAGILGAFMIGGMVPMLVRVPIAATIEMNGLTTSVTDLFNGIMPGLLELLVVMLMMSFVRKKIQPILIVLGSFAVCVAGAAVGIF